MNSFLATLIVLQLSTLKSVNSIQISGEPEHVYKVGLAMKKDKQPYDADAVYSNPSDFKELVKRSQIFIDNSLLIEGIVEECEFQSKYLRISAPMKWGKTTNMRMLQAFFEIQVHENGTTIEPKESTSNYKLFQAGEIVSDNGTVQHLVEPLLIFNKKQLCRRHQGRYPVMYLPFANIIGGTVDQVKRSIDDFIRQLYNQFGYIMTLMIEHKSRIKIDSFVQSKLDRFNQTLHGNVTDQAFALDFLSQVLFEHFVKKVVVIIDDYSAPSIAARRNQKLDEKEIHEIDQLVNDLTYKLTHNFNYNRLIIITGSEDVPLKTFEHFWDNNITARDLPWFKHFGFNQKDVRALFKTRNISDELLKLPDQSYETNAQDVSLATMAQYLNRDDIKKVLLE